MTIETTIVRLAGGLDIVTPAMQTPNGNLFDAVNYEADAAGYRRFIGYERFDGRPSPSGASYHIAKLTGDPSTVTAGATITGATSGTTATVLSGEITDNGVAIAGLSGDFTADEDIEISATIVGTLDGATIYEGETSIALHRALKLEAAELRRTSIAEVPGSGPVRGVHGYDGTVWAIRDNASGTAGVLHKATASGWAAQSLGRRLKFDAGSARFTEGDTITGGTSGASCTLKRLGLISGAWGDSDQAGVIFTDSVTSGPFQDGETITGALGGSATVDGADEAVTLPPGGRYHFVNHNFLGAASSRKMYAVGGVGRAFEWDGTTFAELHTGLSDALDRPTFLAEFASHLWLGYEAGSWLISAPGEPTHWTTTLGAGEIAVGDVPTGALAAASVLVLGSERRMDYITGTSTADFAKKPISMDSGCVPYTMQQADDPIYLDNGAIRLLGATDALGGWRMGSASRRIEPLFHRLRKLGVTPVASMRRREYDLYRVFFSDGSALSVYLGREAPEIMPLRLPITARCTYSGREAGGEYERAFVGAEDGFVYEMDVGTNFDGGEISAMVRTNFVAPKNPQVEHRFHEVLLEYGGPARPTFQFTAETDYGNPYNPPGTAITPSTTGGGGFWGGVFWGDFIWDAQAIGEARAFLNTLGRNVTLAIRTTAAGEEPHTLSMLTFFHESGKLKR